MPTLVAPLSAKYTTAVPGEFVTVICASADVMQVSWAGPSATSGQRTVKATTSTGQEIGPFENGTLVTFTALSGSPTYTAPGYQDAVAALVSGAGKGARIALLGNSITGQARPAIGGEAYTAGNWTPGGAITSGQTLLPPTMDLTNGVKFVKFQALNTGVMGATEPTWPLTIGATVVDGTVTWQAIATTNTSAVYGLSWWSIAQALTGQPFDEVYIVGQSGRQSDTILAKLPEVLSVANPDVVFFANIFENDVWAGAAPNLATISARFDAYVLAVDAARTAGKKVIVQTLLPSGNIDAVSAFTTYSRGNGSKAWAWLNTKIREMARARRDVLLFEPDLLYLDPAQTAGAPWPENTVTYLSKSGAGQALKKTDGIHPYIAAGWIIGSALATLLRANFQAPARFGLAVDETSKSTSPGPLKGGGTRAAAGGDTNVTGTIAAGSNFNLHNYTTSGAGAGTASLVARTDIAGNWQRLAYTAAVNGDGALLAASGIALAPFVVGDVVQAFREIRVVASGLTLMQQFENRLRFSGAGSAFDGISGGYGGIYENVNTGHDLGQFLTADTVFIWKTAPVAIPAGTTGFEVYDKAFFRGVSSGTVDFGRESIRKVTTGALV